MASGLCVIASDGGAAPEIVADGVHGLLFATGDVDALAEKIAWVSHHPDVAAEMGGRAPRKTAERFSLYAQGAALERFLPRQ